MRTFELVKDYAGIAVGTKVVGPQPIANSDNTGYYPEGETNIPGTNCLFSSFVERSNLFTEIKNPDPKTGDRVPNP